MVALQELDIQGLVCVRRYGRHSPQVTVLALTPRGTWCTAGLAAPRQWVPVFPEALLAQLASLPGKSLGVYMALVMRGRTKITNAIELSTERCQWVGITRKQKFHALYHLEQAGVVTVERRMRATPRVTVHALDENGQWNADIRATHHLR
jgi:hypothetical protein